MLRRACISLAVLSVSAVVRSIAAHLVQLTLQSLFTCLMNVARVQAARKAYAAAMGGVHRPGCDADDERLSGGYDGPGPCGVLPPHRAVLGHRHWCLPFSSAPRVHGSPANTTASRVGRTDSDSNSEGSGGAGGAVAQPPAADVSATSNSIRLSLTVTLPDCRSEVDGRGPPFPVVIFINGFQVRGKSMRDCCVVAPPGTHPAR
jgi:hypothetical protein